MKKYKVFLITFFNEFKTVQSSIDAIRREYQDDALIYVAHSNDGSERSLKSTDKFFQLDNLADTVKPYKLAAHAIARNYSTLFKAVYESRYEIEFIVCLTGDTRVIDPTSFNRLCNKMKINNKVLSCSQAIGQNFHSADSEPEKGWCGGRIQYEGISDFMPQFFMVKGDFAHQSKVFSTIEITNEYTSEQCLGDEFIKHIEGDFLSKALVIASNAYSYSDGILYQVKE